jgi:hypothetical protein
MKAKSARITRRQFLKGAGVGFAALALPVWPKGSSKAASLLGMKTNSKVVRLHSDMVTYAGSPVQAIVSSMLDSGITELTGEATPEAGWLSLFPGITQSSVIALKINCIEPQIPSRPEIINSVIEKLTAMEVEGQPFPINNIVVYDRSDSDLTACGWVLNHSEEGLRVFGSQHAGGSSWDYDSPIVTTNGTVYPTSILSEMADYVINIPVLKRHSTAGITSCLKHNMGSIVYRAQLHPDGCDPGLAELNGLMMGDVCTIQDKIVLNIVDSIFITATYGPYGAPEFTDNEILMSTDSVAVDYVGLTIVNDYRLGAGYNPIEMIPLTNGHAGHIQTSADMELGTNDPDYIDEILIEETTATREIDVTSRHRALRASPNPFSTSTSIMYNTGPQASVGTPQVHIYDAAGRHVKTLVEERQANGGGRLIWDGTDSFGKRASSGVYFARLTEGRRNLGAAKLLLYR